MSARISFPLQRLHRDFFNSSEKYIVMHVHELSHQLTTRGTRRIYSFENLTETSLAWAVSFPIVDHVIFYPS